MRAEEKPFIVHSLLNQPARNSARDLSLTFRAEVTQAGGVISSQSGVVPTNRESACFWHRVLRCVCVYVKCIVFSLRPIFFHFSYSI